MGDIETRLVWVGILAVLAQTAMNGTYGVDLAFVIDGYSTAVLQLTLVTGFMLLAYPFLFHCCHSEVTWPQVLSAGIVIFSLFAFTASRLPIPLLPLFVSAAQSVKGDCRVGLIRVVAACLIGVGAFVSLVDVTDMMALPGAFWQQPLQTPILQTVYALMTLMYTGGLIVLARTVTPAMHTAAVVRGGLLCALPLVLVAWGTTWMPVLAAAQPNVRWGTPDPALRAAVAGITIAVAAVKGVLLACMVEFVKFGYLFEFLVLTGFAYLVFPLTVSAVGVPDTATWVGIGFLCAGVLIAFVLLFCQKTRRSPTMFDRDADPAVLPADGVRCKRCSMQPSLLGMCWPPSMWANTAHDVDARRMFPAATVGCNVDCDYPPTRRSGTTASLYMVDDVFDTDCTVMDPDPEEGHPQTRRGDEEEIAFAAP
jgi:hypothetical protein